MGYVKRREIESLEPREEPPMEVLGWVPVSEDLPKQGQEVLATDGKRCGVLSFVDGYIDAVPLQEWDGPLIIPTHWVPLPSPPEVE
jgi:hypothetical protein